MKRKLFVWALVCVALLTSLGCVPAEPTSPSPVAGTVSLTPEPMAAPTATPTAEVVNQVAPTPTVTPEPEPTATPTVAAPVLEPTIALPVPDAEPEPTATPTFQEALRQFVLCSRLVANKQMRWGQAPGTIYSDSPNVSGNIQAGDYIQLLMPQPTSEGVIRIQVYPHDGRAVGRSDGKVWIDWRGLELFRTDLWMFTCED